MSLQWADFPSGQEGLYGGSSSYMLNGTPWVNSSTIVEDPDPLVTGKVLRGGGNSLAISDPDTKIGVAFRFWVSTNPGGTRPFIKFVTTDGSVQYSVSLEANGGFTFREGTNNDVEGATIAAYSSPLLFSNSWHHIEIMLDTASGEFEFRHNGITRLTTTDPNPDNRNVGILSFSSQYAGQGGNNQFHFKDIVVYNSQGSQFNSWQGSVSVYDMLTDADVTLGGWVPSTGSSAWDLLDEAPPNDADYISADDTLPAAAEVTFTPLPPDTTSVRAVMAIVRSLKTDGGDGSLQVSMSPNGINYDNGNNNPITTAATYRWDISELSPATSDPWTPIEANDIRMKFNRTV